MSHNRTGVLDVEWMKAREILARELNISVDQITDDKKLREDLEVDSIIALNIIFSFEKELNLRVTEDDVVSLELVRDLKRLVVSLVERDQHP